MQPEAVLREVDAWIKKAESDFRNIYLVLPAGDAPFDTVCFHAQQASEKYLKALLTFLGIPFIKTHDLPELLLLLPDDSSVPAEVGDLSDLTDAAITSRYPGDFLEYDRNVAEEMTHKAETVKSSVLSELARRDYVPKFLFDDYGSDYKRV